MKQFNKKKTKSIPGQSSKWIAALLLGALAFSNCTKEANEQATNGTVTRKVTKGSPEYENVVHSSYFLTACEIMTADGEQFDENSAVYEGNGSSYEISFKVINEDTREPGLYQKIVYASNGTKTLVYFDEKNPTNPASTGSLLLKWPPSWWPGGGGGSGGGSGGSGGGGGGFCWNWNSWVTTSTYCAYSYPCFFKNQKATFSDQQRSCKNNPNNTQTRTIKLHCGC
jgi:hypothetical protein